MDKREPIECERRRPSAAGTPVVLGDGRHWLLANPCYRADSSRLASPDVALPLNSLFESAVRGEPLEAADLLAVARRLLLVNYELSEAEAADLLTVAPGPESRALFGEVLACLFGPEGEARSFTSWVRASLLANGLGGLDVPAADLLNVLAVLVATNRTIPLTRFADACREADERARLETLI